jgi:hypothetical protein
MSLCVHIFTCSISCIAPWRCRDTPPYLAAQWKKSGLHLVHKLHWLKVARCISYGIVVVTVVSNLHYSAGR